MDKNRQDLANHKLTTTKDKNELSAPHVQVKRRIDLGFIDKSFWEWLIFLATLLGALGAIAIPIAVTIIGLNYSKQQAQSNQNIAKDQQQAAILQTYIDNIQDLLLNHNLLKTELDDVPVLARARTLTALQGLDSKRKGQLLTFIYEAKLIGFADPNGKTHDSIIDLSGADLSGADLSGADLSYAKLNSTDLTNANLNSAKLYDADLTNANLSSDNLTNVHLNSADLINANLSHANAYQTNAELNNANLSYAKLNSADLSGTDLSYANLNSADLTNANLNSANLYTAHLNGAFLNDTDLTVAELNDANLNNANLSDAILHAADLTNATLSGATLIYADLSGAILTNARYLTQQRLDTVRLCTKAILSTGLTCNHNQ